MLRAEQLKSLTYLGKERMRAVNKIKEIDGKLYPLMIEMHNEGIPLSELSSRVGLTRQRIHQIIQIERSKYEVVTR